MLPEMARQSVNCVVEPNECRHSWMFLRQTGLLDLRLQIERVRKIAIRKQMRKSIENIRRKIQRFADFAGGTSPAITDHIGGHGGAVLAIAPINFLNDRFAPIAARKIEIDIGPAFAAFVQKPLEDKIITDRIDRRDAEAITNGAVGCAPPTLD